MTADLWAGGLGALWFFLLALLLGAGGVGLLALTGCRERLTAPLFLAPAVMLASWTVLCSAAAWLRFPIAAVAPWLWGVTLLLAAWGGLVLLRTAQVRRTASAPGAGRRIDAAWLVPTMLAFLLPLAVMPGVLRFGLEDFAGSSHLDSWSYIAFADYLLLEARGAEGRAEPAPPICFASGQCPQRGRRAPRLSLDGGTGRAAGYGGQPFLPLVALRLRRRRRQFRPHDVRPSAGRPSQHSSSSASTAGPETSSFTAISISSWCSRCSRPWLRSPRISQRGDPSGASPCYPRF